MLKDRRIRLVFRHVYKLNTGEFVTIEAEEGGTMLDESDREDEWDLLHNQLEKEFDKRKQRFKKYIRNECK